VGMSNERTTPMTKHQTATTVMKLACFTLLGGLGLLGVGRNLGAQEKGAEEPKVRDQAAQSSLVVAGYTRPGNPSDKAKGGRIIAGGYLAGDPDFKGLGGTVFFAVFRLSHDEGDVWGTGVKDFDTTFTPGSDYNHADSPVLDTRAKYLYLYQVVNSRGLDPISPVKFAANKDMGTRPIATAAVRLRVDPRYITSWGHFKSTGFTLGVVPEDLDGKKEPVKGVVGAAGEKGKDGIKTAFEADQEGAIRMAVSVEPSILGSLSSNAYLWRAPSHSLNRVRVNDATLNLANSKAIKDLENRVDALKKNNTKPAAWASEMLKSAKAANEPSLVRLMLSEPDARLYLQADWFAKGAESLLKLADHSTVFGFTTDLPPVPEPVGIAAPEGRAQLLAVLDSLTGEGAAAGPAGGGVVPAVGEGPGGVAPAAAPGVAPAAAPGVAPGSAVGPIQPAAFAPTAAGGGAAFGSALPATGGFGAGLPGGLGVGGIGRAFPATTGGGSGAGTGGGTGSGSGNGNGNSASTNTGTNTGTQAQAQAQGQAQAQNGTQQGSQTVTQTQGNQTVTSGNQTVSTTVNVNVAQQQQQAQAQAQAQLQAQAQAQSQRQNNHGHQHQHVVPEPGTIILALLGLPVLFFHYRRRKMATLAVGNA
jgi:hypothetical protein